jgi:hypothetical protein
MKVIKKIKKQKKINNRNNIKNSIIIITALFTSLVSISKAQDADDDTRNKLNIGAKVGANRSNVYDAQGQDFKADAKMGFAGGVFVGIPIGKFLGIQPEVLISQKGSQSSGTLLGFSYSDKRTANY